MSRRRFAALGVVFAGVLIGAGWMGMVTAPLQAARGDQKAGTSASPRQRLSMPFAEYPADALHKGIQGTVLIDLTVSPEGGVSSATVVSGPQGLSAPALQAAYRLKYSPASSTTPMQIAIVYSQSQGSWGVQILERLPAAGIRSVPMGSDPGLPRMPARAGQVAQAATGTRIGGDIQTPRRVHGENPVHPPIARAAGVEGVVLVDARIDEAGHVTDARVLRSIPLLDQAAVQAVKQWKYEPTLVNGVPVPITMTVTVPFTMSSRERGLVRVRITLPDGSVSPPFEIAPNDGIALTLAKDVVGKFGFALSVDWASSAPVVRVAIYDMAGAESGAAPRLLDTVDVPPGGGVVRSATTRSLGIEVLGLERPSGTP